MATLAIDDFKSKLIGGGARSNLFRATINFPRFANGDPELSSFMIKAANLPASTLGEIEVPFRGRIAKYPGDRTFENWEITVINDTGFEIRDALERWSNEINGHVSNEGPDNASFYTSNLIVEQLNKSGQTLKAYTFFDAAPINVAQIDLSAENTNQIEEFGVTFQYQYWTARTTDSNGSLDIGL